jgi:hypothetical protein
MTLHHVPGTKSAPGVYIVHREGDLLQLRFFGAGDPLREQCHRTRLAFYGWPVIIEEITG